MVKRLAAALFVLLVGAVWLSGCPGKSVVRLHSLSVAVEPSEGGYPLKAGLVSRGEKNVPLKSFMGRFDWGGLTVWWGEKRENPGESPGLIPGQLLIADPGEYLVPGPGDPREKAKSPGETPG